MHSLVTSIFLYACESWTLTAEFQRKMQAMEMRCYHRILRTSYKDHLPTKKSVPRSRRQSHTQRSPDHHKETQTTVVWSCLPFIRSGQNHLARHSERGKKTRQTEEEVGNLHQKMDRTGLRQVPQGSGEQGKKWRKLVVK